MSSNFALQTSTQSGRSKLATYWHVARIAAREDRANPAKLAGSLLLGIVRMVVIAAIYKVAYDTVGSGTTHLPLANALWSIGVYFAFMMGLRIRDIFRRVNEEVRTGAVEVGLLKPLDWRFTKVAQNIGKYALECLMLTLTFTVTLSILVGLPDVSYLTLPNVLAYLVIVLFAALTMMALYLTVGLAAFWLSDAQSVYRIIDKFVMIFSGAFVPVALFPDLMQTFIRYSPFGVIAAVTQLFNKEFFAHLGPSIIAAILWSIVLLGVCQVVWNRARLKLEVNGG